MLSAIRCLATCACVVAFAPCWAADAPARPRLQPTTLQDVPHLAPFARVDTQVDASAAPAAALAAVGPTAGGQIAYIDPLTDLLVPTPPRGGVADAASPPPPMPSRLELRISPAGFLYIDTRDYLHSSEARLDANGELHLGCRDPGHAHGDDTAQVATELAAPAPKP